MSPQTMLQALCRNAEPVADAALEAACLLKLDEARTQIH